ncbi:MAG: hypothetical protein HZB71_09390 [Betaproteobacteria bacterium]|nr:hypothetical protein [Betaproteobacteria bacterium]
MTARLFAFVIAPALLLAGCFLQDTASVELNGRDNAITLKRTQQWPWDSDLQVEVIMRRMPDCNAGGTIEDVAHDAKLFLYYATENGVFLLKTGKRHYSVNSENCKVTRLKEAPEERGDKIGTFAEKDGVFQFAPAPAKTPGADEGNAQ